MYQIKKLLLPYKSKKNIFLFYKIFFQGFQVIFFQKINKKNKNKFFFSLVRAGKENTLGTFGTIYTTVYTYQEYQIKKEVVYK